MSFVLKHASLLDHQSFYRADVKISKGKIVSIGQDLHGTQEFDLKGSFLSPGLVDLHVHFREPGFEDKETIQTGGLAAARGGVTTVGVMANTSPVIDSLERFQNLQQALKKDCIVHAYPYAAVTKNLTSKECVDFSLIPAFAFCNDGIGIQEVDVMREALKQAKEKGVPLAVHLETEALVKGGVMREGKVSQRLSLPGIPSSFEYVQLARDLALAYEIKGHYHACHLSTSESVDLIRLAKKKGIHVTAEVTPHHLLLSEEDVDPSNANYKMKPPLGTKKDNEALLEGLIDGTIDMISTDHAPHTQKEKERGFLTAPFGIVGVETSFALLYTKLVRTRKLSLTRLIEAMSTIPAQKFHLPVPQIRVGEEANLAVFDLEHEGVIDPKEYASKSKNSPFNGEKVYGKTLMTIVDGKIVYQKENEDGFND